MYIDERKVQEYKKKNDYQENRKHAENFIQDRQSYCNSRNKDENRRIIKNQKRKEVQYPHEKNRKDCFSDSEEEDEQEFGNKKNKKKFNKKMKIKKENNESETEDDWEIIKNKRKIIKSDYYHPKEKIKSQENDNRKRKMNRINHRIRRDHSEDEHFKKVKDRKSLRKKGYDNKREERDSSIENLKKIKDKKDIKKRGYDYRREERDSSTDSEEERYIKKINYNKSETSGSEEEILIKRVQKKEKSLGQIPQIIKYLKTLGIKFTGEEKNEDPEDFLDQLEDYKKGLDIGDEELLDALPCIFRREASRWFRTIRDSLGNWRDFKKAFKNQYLEEYDREDLMDDFRNRTQGKGEKITKYLASMRYIISKFAKPPSLKNQRERVYKNLLPEYRKAMSDKIINSLEDIEEYGRLWERQLDLDERWNPPPPPDKMKIKGAAFTGNSKTTVNNKNKVSSISEEVAAVNFKSKDREQKNKQNKIMKGEIKDREERGDNNGEMTNGNQQEAAAVNQFRREKLTQPEIRNFENRNMILNYRENTNQRRFDQSKDVNFDNQDIRSNYRDVNQGNPNQNKDKNFNQQNLRNNYGDNQRNFNQNKDRRFENQKTGEFIRGYERQKEYNQAKDNEFKMQQTMGNFRNQIEGFRDEARNFENDKRIDQRNYESKEQEKLKGERKEFLGICFTCRAVGHRASECPEVVCYWCEEKGHTSRYCFNKPNKFSKSCQNCNRPGFTFKTCLYCKE